MVDPNVEMSEDGRGKGTAMGKHLYNEDMKGNAGELLGESLSDLLRRPSRDSREDAANESSPRGLEPLDMGGS